MTSAASNIAIPLPEPTPRAKRSSTDMALSVSIVGFSELFNTVNRSFHQQKVQAYTEATSSLEKVDFHALSNDEFAALCHIDRTSIGSSSLYAVKDRRNDSGHGVRFIASNLVKNQDTTTTENVPRLVLKQCVHPTYLPKGVEIKAISHMCHVEFHDIHHRRNHFDVFRFETLDGVLYDFFDFYGNHILVNDGDKIRAFVDEQVRLGLEDGRIDKMIQARREWKYEQTLAPGEYYIGDPCYLFIKNVNDDKWMALLHATNWFTSRSQSIANTPISCHHTAHGDGVFCDSDMHSYGVDSGNLGIIPTSVITVENGMKLSNKVYAYGRIVTFDQPFVVKAHMGVFTFGDIKIDTRSSDIR